MEKNRKQIRVQVRNKVAELVDKEQFIVGGNDDYDVVFDFDEAWDDYPAKTALFVYGETVVEKVIIGNVCEGVSVEGASVVGIGVYSGDQSTTTPAFLNCKQSIRDLAKYKTPVAPSEDVYAQIIELLNQYIAEVNNIVAKAVEDYLVANPPEAAFSPVVSVAPIEGGHRVTITDINESHTFDVMNGAKGERGEKGDKGDRGAQGERGEQGIQGERGEKGEQGIQGEAGYTPQRGVDYWTPEDISEVQEYAQNVAAREASKAVVDLVEPTLKNHDRRIEQIERHISNDYILTDDSVAYMKPIDPDVCPYAQINTVGGMTYECNNLIKFPYVTPTTSGSGVTFTVSNDGAVAISGKGNYYFSVARVELKGGTTYTLSGVPANGGYNSYYLYLTEADGTQSFDIGKGVTFTAKADGLASITIVYNNPDVEANAIIKPMLNEGSTALPYELWYEGTRNSKVTEIISKGANLYSGEQNIELPASAGKVIFEGEINNPVVFSYVADGTYTNMGVCFFEFVEANGTVVQPSAYGNPQKLNGLKKILLRNWCGFTGTVSNIMLNYGDTASPYKPHREPISYPIPAEIQALEGYGVGMSSANTDYNYIDFEHKAYRVQVELDENFDPPAVLYHPEPYEVDVSKYLKDFDGIIEVEGGGRLEFVNEYKNPVPSSVTYLLKEGSI